MTTASTAARVGFKARRRGGHRERSSSDRAPRPGGLYILPAVTLFGLFAILPVVLVVYLSFTEWNALGDPVIIGVDNWTRLFSDDAVAEATGRTFLLMAMCWVAQIVPSIAIGVWAAGRERNRAVLSAIFFLPLLLSSAAISLMWKAMFDPNFGLASTIGPYIGFEDGNIIGSAGGALGCIVFVVTWQFVPFHSLLYQAAARNIPQSLYDAALLDGAGRWAAFWHVTLPQLRNTIVTSSIIMLVGSLTYFETILLLTDGGPGTSTQVLPFLMYTEGFRSYELGYASAIATGLVLLGTALSLVIVKFSGFSKMRSTLEGV